MRNSCFHLAGAGRLFVLSVFVRDVLDEIWDLLESVSEGFPNYSLVYSCIMRHGNEELKVSSPTRGKS